MPPRTKNEERFLRSKIHVSKSHVRYREWLFLCLAGDHGNHGEHMSIFRAVGNRSCAMLFGTREFKGKHGKTRAKVDNNPCITVSKGQTWPPTDKSINRRSQGQLIKEQQMGCQAHWS